MADTHDPTDHFRTTHQHAGEYFIDLYCWPGLWSIALGTISLICCIAATAYRRHEWILTTGIVGVLAVAGGVAWLLSAWPALASCRWLWKPSRRSLSCCR